MKSGLYEFLVGYQLLDYGRPCLVECLIPDTSGKVFFDIDFLPFCDFSYLSLFFLNLFLPLFIGHFVDFVDEDEDVGILVELFDAS